MHHFHVPPHQIKYFEGKISKGFTSLFISKAITNVAGGLFAIFLPLFLYNLFSQSVSAVAGYYLASYVIQLLILFIFSPYLNKFGFRRALRFSTVIAVVYYTALFFVNESNYQILIPIIVFLIAFWRFLYWIPFNIDMAKFTTKKDRGKEVSLMEVAYNITSIITPVIAGVIVGMLGFNILFLIGIVVFSLSFFPLLTLPKTREHFGWTRRKMFSKIFAKENRTAALIFIADGAEVVVGAVIWPIFIFQIFKGNYAEVGLISTLVVGVTVVLQLIVGKYTDKKPKNKEKLMKYGGALYALGWIFKIFVLTAFHVFVIDAFHKLTQAFYRVPLDAFVFEKAKGEKHLVDEFNIFRQATITTGRALMALIILVAAFYVSINWLFLFGALFSIFLSFIHTRLKCQLR